MTWTKKTLEPSVPTWTSPYEDIKITHHDGSIEHVLHVSIWTPKEGSLRVETYDNGHLYFFGLRKVERTGGGLARKAIETTTQLDGKGFSRDAWIYEPNESEG